MLITKTKSIFQGFCLRWKSSLRYSFIGKPGEPASYTIAAREITVQLPGNLPPSTPFQNGHKNSDIPSMSQNEEF
jgi:hypothetical protein